MVTPSRGEVETQFALLFAELAHRRESQSRRLGSAETVAGIIVGAGAVLAGLAAGGGGEPWLLAVTSVCSITAAGLGLWALLPRVIKELDPAVYRESLLRKTAVDAQLWMSNRLIEHIEFRERLLRSRFVLVRVGLSLLVLAMLGLLAARLAEIW